MARMPVVDLIGVDEIEISRPRLRPLTLDRAYLRARFDRADAERVVRMRREFMRDERRAQALHPLEARIAPESRSLDPLERHGLDGLFL